MAANFFGLTDTGKQRDNNEDSFITEQVFEGWILACVIDGVGGYEGGEVAAEIARTTLLNSLKGPFTAPELLLRQAVLQANSNIYNEKKNRNGKEQMACVLTIALVNVEANQFYYAHVGDTRLYLLRDGSLVKVTKDHSFVGFLEDSGRLSETEAMQHPKRNEINKALGFDGGIEMQEGYVETGTSPFLPNDVLMLCSDGLTDMVNNSSMKQTLETKTSLEQKANKLIEAANAAGGKDNITVVLVSNDKKPASQKATKPVLIKKNRSEETTPAPVKETSKPPVAVPIPKPKKGNAAVWILALLCLALAATCFWLWGRSKPTSGVADPQAVKTVSPEQKALANQIELGEDTVTLTAGTVVLSDTVFIRQDSLRIMGNGLVLQKDSSYNGPAFLVSPNNKYLLIEGVTFRDFPISVFNKGKSVQLRNVQFSNSTTPVLQAVSMPAEDTVSASILDTFYRTKNQLPK